MTDDGFTRDAEAIRTQLAMARTRRALAITNRDRALVNIDIAKHNARVHAETITAENHCIDTLLDALSEIRDKALLEQMVDG